MARFLGVIFSLFLCLHSAAHAEDGGRLDAPPVPAQASDLPEPLQNGIVVDANGIFFGSGFVLTVPAVPGTTATEGPSRGPADYGANPPDSSTYREAMP